MRDLAQPFEPSRRAPAAPGPKTRMPAARRASASPATRGASGPMTTRSTNSLAAMVTSPGRSLTTTGRQRASSASPGLPGAHMMSATRGLFDRLQTSACSRPPPPTTRTLTIAVRSGSGLGAPGRRRGQAGHGLGRLGPHGDLGDGHAHHLLQAFDIGLGGLREVGPAAGPADVRLPSRELLVDGHRLVEDGLVRREALVGLSLVLVADADPDPVEGREDVDLGEEDLGQRADPRRIAHDDGVEPPAATRAAGRRTELGPPLDEEVAVGTQILGGERSLP